MVYQGRRGGQSEGKAVDFAVHGNKFATISADNRVAVWDLRFRTRITSLQLSPGKLRSVALSSRLLVVKTATIVRRDPAGRELVSERIFVYDVTNDYACISKIDDLHSGRITSLRILADGIHIMTTSMDNTLCFTQGTTDTLAARVDVGIPVQSAIVLRDGNLVISSAGVAAIRSPPAIAGLLREHASAEFSMVEDLPSDRGPLIQHVDESSRGWPARSMPTEGLSSTSCRCSQPLYSYEAYGKLRDETCSICLGPLADEKISMGPCLHAGHTRCLTEWHAKIKNDLCPVCRHPFVESYIISEDDTSSSL